ncbi:hypothetical protein ACO2I3_10150 [Leptospira interrogans]
MDLLEESALHVEKEYQRRFNDPLEIAARDLDPVTRGKFIAALERALQRNMPLFDYELEEFEVSRWQRLWLRLTRFSARLVGRNAPVV